jgi:UPF0716 family protein affecting phage T7 exclusion
MTAVCFDLPEWALDMVLVFGGILVFGAGFVTAALGLVMALSVIAK